MRILIAEDDLASRKFLSAFLSSYGECDLTVDGIEALDAFLLALEEGRYYDLICIDIMMPRVDGLKVLRILRNLENQKSIDGGKRAKVIMTSALNDPQTVSDAYALGCEYFIDKPIDVAKLKEALTKLRWME